MFNTKLAVPIHRFLRLAALVASALLLLLRISDPQPVQQLREVYFDKLQQLWPRAMADGPSPIAIIDIDDASLQRLGQWPWPRRQLADLVGRCANAGAVGVAFDFLFAEADRTSPQNLSHSMAHWPAALRADLRALPDHDQLFAASFAALPVVLGMAGQPQGAAAPAAALPIQSMLGGDPLTRVLQFPGVLTSLPVLTSAAAGLGWISLVPSRDGVVRQVPLLAANGEQVYPALSIELLRLALGGKGWITLMSAAGIEQVMTQTAQGELSIPADPNGLFRVYYTSPGGAAQTIPAWQVLAGQAEAALRDRLVLVGSSAQGFNDIHPTPLGRALPGIEVHANILSAILGGQFLTRPSWTLGAELTALLLLALLVGWAGQRLGPLGLAAFVVTLAALLFALGAGLFLVEHWLLDISFALLLLLCLGVLWGTANAVQSFQERRQIRQAFQHYLSPELVEQLSRSATPPRLGGESRQLTILFCDIRDFTSLSESLSPEHLGRLMNCYLSAMSSVVLQHRGTIDKYIGDCIMAFWNAPIADPEHALHACQAALTMRAELPAINQKLRTEGLLEPEQSLRIGIGIHTAVVAVGNFGSQQRFDYTVLGDGVNLTARLEGLCKTYARDILVSQAVHGQAPQLPMEALGTVQVRGKQESVDIFSL